LPSLNHILGLLVVLGALAMGIHEIWIYTHPQAQGFPVSHRRLRRRLLGVALILAMVGLFTWAGYSEGNLSKLSLYGAALLLVFVLIGLALSDLRETSRQILRDQLDMEPDEVRRLMTDPAVRDIVRRFEKGALGEGDLETLTRRVSEKRESHED
jgi:hypothetical protein